MAEQGSNDKKENENKLKMIAPIFLVLSLFVVCLTFASGILIGRHTKNTMFNPPSSVMEAGGEDGKVLPIQIGGRVTLSDGTPAASIRLQLHSVVQETYSDEKGWFFFQDAGPVCHELYAVDSQGNTIASVILDLRLGSQKNRFEVKDMEDGRVNIDLSSDVFYIEMDVKLDSVNGTLMIDPKTCYAVSDENLVYTTDGTLDVESGITVLPSGTVISRQCEIIHYPVVVRNDRTVEQMPESGLTLSDGTIITKEEIKLPDGAAVTSEGEVVHTKPSEEKSNTSSSSPGTENPAIPSETPSFPGSGIQQPDNGNSDVDNNGSSDSDHSHGENSDHGGNGGHDNTPTEPGVPDEPDIPTEPGAPDEPVELTVSGENRSGTWNAWVSNEQIDLFYHQKDANTADEIPVICPGSSGWYYFDLVNNGKDAIQVTIRMTEDTIHLPFRFRLLQVSEGAENVVADWTTPMTRGHSIVLLDGKRLNTDMTVHYKMEWEWPYETGIPGEDENDTAVAGSSTVAGRTYFLNMNIYAEGI